MKKVGIVLLVIQAIAILGSIANGSFGTMPNVGNPIAYMLGFFLPAIIGLILIAVGSKKKQEKND